MDGNKERVVVAMRINLQARGISVDGPTAWRFVGDAIDALAHAVGEEAIDVSDLESWYEDES